MCKLRLSVRSMYHSKLIMIFLVCSKKLQMCQYSCIFMKEQFESVSSYIVDYLWDQPAIYCGTYKKYNEGSLFGAG